MKNQTEFERCVAFEKAIWRRSSTELVTFELGEAMFHDDLPDVYDRNLLWIDHPVDAAAIPLLENASEELAAERNLAHRKILASEDLLEEAVVDHFGKAPWEAARLVTMVLRDPVAPGPDARGVAEFDADEYRQFTHDAASEEPEPGRVVEQLVEAAALLAESAQARYFGIEAGGRIVSGCHLYSEGSIAQIEDVATLRDFRKKGFARRVVTKAVQEARRAGHELVFLGADEDDWPKELYRKLGFEPVGRSFEFFSKPGRAS